MDSAQQGIGVNVRAIEAALHKLEVEIAKMGERNKQVDNIVESVPKLFNSISEINHNISTIKHNMTSCQSTFASIENRLEKQDQKIENLEDRGKFDFMTWVKNNALPTILGAGVVTMIINIVKNI